MNEREWHHNLLLRIHAFIRRHLADPDLSPEVIAAAHNISLRSLHRLFRAQNTTVGGWVRAQRLDRCRRDLTDPALRDQPIRDIAARWALTEAAHFTRAFHAAYGINPKDYRNRHDDASWTTRDSDATSKRAESCA